jgi:hypothetical protein
MGREYIDSEENLNEREYARGFNAATIIADYQPELLNEIVRSNNICDNYFDGFFAGKQFCLDEISHNQELEDLQSLRSESKERDNELER